MRKGADVSDERTLPITGVTREYFERQELQERQRRLALNGGENYYETT